MEIVFKMCVKLSSILRGMDELVNERWPDGWFLAGVGRPGRWAMRSKEAGGCKRAWLFSWKGEVECARLERLSGKKTFFFYCTRCHNGLSG